MGEGKPFLLFIELDEELRGGAEQSHAYVLIEQRVVHLEGARERSPLVIYAHAPSVPVEVDSQEWGARR